MGFSQQTFYFDQPPEQNLKKEVLAFIYSTIAGNDQVTLDQVANHFCMQSDRWTKSLIRNLVNDLFRDDQIQFIIAETKFSSEKIKNLLSEPGQSLAKFKQIRNNLSTLKTHLSESAQWKYIEIIKPEVVEKSVLIQAQHLGKKLFKQTVSMNQNKLCQNLRKHLRMWRSDLEEFKKVSETGNYPGTNEIQKGLDLLNKLLSVHDPCKFLETFLNNENRLCDAYSHFIILDNFYKHQIHSWNALVEAVEVFKPNRMLLEKDPDVGKALELLCKMLKDPKPYSMIKEISGLISVVKAANDPIVEKQITSEKALAVERLDKRIDKIAKLLDEKNVNDDIRNKALFPLQTSKRKIITAISIQSISDYLEHGLDQFDNTIEMLS